MTISTPTLFNHQAQWSIMYGFMNCTFPPPGWKLGHLLISFLLSYVRYLEKVTKHRSFHSLWGRGLSVVSALCPFPHFAVRHAVLINYFPSSGGISLRPERSHGVVPGAGEVPGICFWPLTKSTSPYRCQREGKLAFLAISPAHGMLIS